MIFFFFNMNNITNLNYEACFLIRCILKLLPIEMKNYNYTISFSNFFFLNLIFVQFIHFFLSLKNSNITKFRDNFERAY